MKHLDGATWLILLAVVSMGTVAPVAAQQGGQLLIDGSTATPALVPIGNSITVSIIGPASHALAMMVAFEPLNAVPTPLGPLGLDPTSRGAFFFLNGFDPSHSAYAQSVMPAVGPWTDFAIPFQDRPAGRSFWAQVAVADPTVAEGATLTNTIQCTSLDPIPVIRQSTPNYGEPGGTLHVEGENFGTNPSLIAVSFDGEPCVVLDAEDTWVHVLIPTSVDRSGTITITTPSGTVGGNPNDIRHWVTLLSTPLQEVSATGIVHAGPRTTILGLIDAPGARDHYTLHVNQGEEVYAEAYSWDQWTQLITGAVNSNNAFFDPVLRIKRGTLTLVEDDDSAPQYNAAIGVSGGDTFFVADETEDLVIEVDTHASGGIGIYVLVMGTRAPSPMPLWVNGIHPNVARVNDTVQVYVTGVTAGDPARYTIRIGDTEVIPSQALLGRLDFMVPAGTRSDAIAVEGPTGATHHLQGRMASWLSVIPLTISLEPTMVPPVVVGPGACILGHIGTGSELDTYRFQGQHGHHYRIEAIAFDPGSGRAVSSALFAPFPLDPDLRVHHPGQPLPALITDGNGGPGFNSLIGGNVTGVWVCPATDLFDITVVSFLGISRGDYLLQIVDVTLQ